MFSKFGKNYVCQVYEVRVENRSEKLIISGPENTLTIRLAGNDSEGWAEYGGIYLCRVTNGYSSDHRFINITVVNIPAAGMTTGQDRFLEKKLVGIYCTVWKSHYGLSLIHI